ncbi:unnamed protein product [Rhizoctonia solani]|uniref:WKF domain-containing protein n=1 Tax=Rhizoctonia solani TaxID=456999 RepID=A0A8H3DH15_9AGAM|nr:unnamed protein product [Rhizoctonia solani]
MASAPAVQPLAPIDKKSKKQGQKGDSADTRSDSIQKEKKKRRKRDEDPSTSKVGAATEATQVTESSDRPTKKHKKNVPETVTPEDQQSPELEGVSLKKPKREKRPKKPKDKSKTLPNEARLAYAYQYSQHISLSSESERAAKHAWKFNKARQNWILRNIIDPAVIPDSHLPISLTYVASIQGGARDELRKTCKITKKQAKASKALSSNDQNQSKESSATMGESTKKVTFAAGTAEPATIEPETSAPSKIKVKRAKIILKVLKGKIQPQDI